MNCFILFFLFTCTVLFCCGSPLKNSIEPIECVSCEMKGVRLHVHDILMNSARRKRDTHIYNYNYSSSVTNVYNYNFKMHNDNSRRFIIGPGSGNTNYVKLGNTNYVKLDYNI